jgi:hypothetical protein
MDLNIRRPFSDRVIFDEALPAKFRITNSFWDWVIRIISWVFSPAFYSDENRRTVHCFKEYLLDTLGEERLQRISGRYGLDLNEMERKGNPLLSRHVAQIVVGAQNVGVEDIPNFEQLNAEELDEAIKRAKDPFGGIWKVCEVSKAISGRATDWTGTMWFDPFLSDRERLQLCRKHPTATFESFIHNMVARVIKREMDVGTLIQAPNRADGIAQYYYVSGKLVTGEGMVSYVFRPATGDTALEPMRLFRGTSARNGEIDGISTVITDLERHLGKSAYESGLPYEEYIEPCPIEAGHSLGSALVQHRLVDMDHIRAAYLYSGPGIAVERALAFNRKKEPVRLVIRQVEGDTWSHVGGAHLGWKSNQNVDYRVTHPNGRTPHSRHVIVWSMEPFPHRVREDHSVEERDKNLYSESNWTEFVRSTFGPPTAMVLKAARDVSRAIFSSRTDEERGLHLGQFKNHRWQVEYIGPLSYNAGA